MAMTEYQERNAKYASVLSQVAASGEITFQQAVATIKLSPLTKYLSEDFQSILSSTSDDGITATGALTLAELLESVTPETRESADLARLIVAAEVDHAAYLACEELAIRDLERPGTPNIQLQRWLTQVLRKKIEKPSGKKGKREHLLWRDTALTILLNDAVALGYHPTKNRHGVHLLSAGDVVAEALKIPFQRAGIGNPIAIIEKAGEKHNSRILFNSPKS